MNLLKIVGWIVAIPLVFAFNVGMRSLEGDLRTIVFLLFFGAIALVIVYGLVSDWRMRRNDQWILDRLLTTSPRWTAFDWELPAPESYLLLRGMEDGARDAFKVGLLQLIAMGTFVTEKSRAADGSDQTFLVALQPPPQRLSGSLTGIYECWTAASEDPTMRGIAKQAREKWGSMEKFADEAARELVGRGYFIGEHVMHFRIFPGHRYVHTGSGLAAQARFEGVVAGTLQQLRARVWNRSDRPPRRWLIAGVVAAAATGGRLADQDAQVSMPAVDDLERGLAATSQPSGTSWYVGGHDDPSSRAETKMRVEAPFNHGVPAPDEYPASSFDETNFDWASWDDLDGSLAEIDSSIGADGGGDGGDGGGDGGGGD